MLDYCLILNLFLVENGENIPQIIKVFLNC
jgi:hypothetical protein